MIVSSSAEACALVAASVLTATATIATDSPVRLRRCHESKVMKPTRPIQYLFSATLLCSVPPQCHAQAPPGLGISTYTGVSITGAVGTVYTIQYNTNLTQPDGWQGAGIVQLPSSPYLWVDTAAPVARQRVYRAVEGPTNLAWLPPGTFTMGSPSNEVERRNAGGPQTVVTLTSGFFMGKYPVTQGEYLAVMGNNPSYFRNGTDGTNSGRSEEH